MLYVRSAASDYDDWAAFGNDGWGFNELLPFIRKVGVSRHATDKSFTNQHLVRNIHAYTWQIDNTWLLWADPDIGWWCRS